MLWSVSMAWAGQLTVIVAVDGLDGSSLEEMQPYWQQGGLRTITEEGSAAAVNFDHWLYGGEESLATMLTGCNPATHGVSMNYIFSPADRKTHPLFLNNKQMGIGTDESYSPEPLMAWTIADRFRLRNPSARVYGIGITPAATMVLGGRSANACAWMGQTSPTDSLHWVSTLYYKEGLPTAALRMNTDGSFSRIANREWTPRMEINAYNHPTDEEKNKPFAYKGQDILTSSPMANALVVELALAIQKDKQLGVSRSDMLMLQMTAVTPRTTAPFIASAEQEDMYLRLNQDLGFLMEQLEKRVGKEHIRLVVMGIPRVGVDKKRLEELNLPVRTFNLDRAIALTSTYLMALYEHERWVDGGCAQAIYLNRELIAQKKLSLEQMRRQVADFLMEFEGVRFACPANEAYLHPEMFKSIHKRFAGDVVFTLQPDYQLITTGYSASGQETEIVLDALLDDRLTTPVLFWPSQSVIPLIPATDLINYL